MYDRKLPSIFSGSVASVTVRRVRLMTFSRKVSAMTLDFASILTVANDGQILVEAILLSD